MKTMEIGNGQVLIGTQDCGMMGTVSPLPDGFWVGVGYSNQQGLLVDSHEWKAFVDLVKAIDSYVEENYGQVRS
jgi:hypothetical protein